ncbi:MAG: hypothetical protein R3F14_03145 [Polyangiaceae bacterium]
MLPPDRLSRRRPAGAPPDPPVAPPTPPVLPPDPPVSVAVVVPPVPPPVPPAPPVVVLPPSSQAGSTSAVVAARSARILW